MHSCHLKNWRSAEIHKELEGHRTSSLGKSTLFDLAETLTQCREYHREQLCNWLKTGRSLDLTCGGQKVSLPLCASGMRVRERNPSQRALLFLSSLFNIGAELAYLTSTGQTNWRTEYRPITKLLPMIFSTLCQIFNQIEQRWISP